MSDAIHFRSASLSLALLVLAACRSPDFKAFEVVQCSEVGATVDAAQDGFAKYRLGTFDTKGDGAKEWAISPPLQTWDSCRLRADESERTAAVICTLPFRPGQFDRALKGYKGAVKSMRECIAHGPLSTFNGSFNGDVVRSASFDVKQERNQLYDVVVDLSVMLFSPPSAGGSEVRLEVTAKRKYRDVRN